MAPVVVTRLGGEQRIFPVGMPIRVGRDPSAELVSANPLVSRCHGVIASDEHGATYTDQSRRGTFINGKRLRSPLRITHSVILHLGDPATGEEVGITPPLSSAQIARNRRRKTLSGRMLAGVVVAGAVAAAALSAGLLLSSHPQPGQSASPSANSSIFWRGICLQIVSASVRNRAA